MEFAGEKEKDGNESDDAAVGEDDAAEMEILPSAPKKKEQGRKKLEAVSEARLKMEVHTTADVASGYDNLPGL